MLEINHLIEGDWVVEQDTTFSGNAQGDVLVRNGATFVLNGNIMRDLVIEEAARVVLNGAVQGDVIARGGILDVNGKVFGRLIFQENTPV